MLFNDEFLERLFADPEVNKIPIGCQSTMIDAIERLLEEFENANELWKYTDTNS